MGLLVSCYNHKYLGVKVNRTMWGWLPSTGGTTWVSFEDILFSMPVHPRLASFGGFDKCCFKSLLLLFLLGILILSEQDHAQCDKSWASTAGVLHWIRTPPLINWCGYCQKESKPSKRMKFMWNISATSQRTVYCLYSSANWFPLIVITVVLNLNYRASRLRHHKRNTYGWLISPYKS